VFVMLVRRSITIGAVALLGAVMCAGLVSGCGSTPAAVPKIGTVRVDAAADGTTIRVAKGSTLEVALDSNPTTGFDWQLAGAVPSQVTTVGSTLEATATGDSVGAGGIRVFTYTAATAGTGTLRLEYVRPWEKGVPPAKTFTLTVVVQ
jgi:inhibitor of cysteine peptidase